MRRVWKNLWLGGTIAICSGAIACAQTAPLKPAAPLASEPSAVSVGQVSRKVDAAERAHEFGQLTAAALLYRDLIAIDSADRERHTLALASVLLDAGQPAEAAAALDTLPAPHHSAWQLRAGLAALQLRKRDAAQAAWDAIKPDELSSADRAWYVFLQAALYDWARDVRKANELYLSAMAIAPNELAKSRFHVAADRARMQLPPLEPEKIDEVRSRAEQFQGTSVGYQEVENYAVMLAQARREAEAVRFLQQQLLPTGLERRWRERFLILTGLIGDRTRAGTGRAALVQLVTTGNDPDTLRQALQLLADASPAGAERTQFRTELNRWIAATPAHPVKETMLFFRAQLALADQDFAAAEKDAEQLVKDFPNSPLRVHGWSLLTQSAWNQGRFRQAAAHAQQARDALPVNAPPDSAAGRARADLGVLVAEAWFRAGWQTREQAGIDFRRAADAYAAVLSERAPTLSLAQRGGIIFQRVLAEIRAGSPETAAKVLDEFARDPALDIENRWEAEWSLARALQVAGEIQPALERIRRLMGEPTPENGKLPPALRARMQWLQARLTFNAGRFPEALALIDALLGSLGEIDPKLQSEISSTIVLLRARTQFALGDEKGAIESLNKLRAEHASSDAAMHSYLIQAAHYAAQGKVSDAQLQLTSLTDNKDYKNSEYVPYALFQLALLSEQLGGEENLKVANKRLEDLIELVGKSASPETQASLVFAARMRQGDIFRRRNDYPSAQRAYEELLIKFPQRRDIDFAQLSLAETHNAQSATDTQQADLSHADLAQSKFEELLDRVSAAPDVRVEAGYNLGLLLLRKGKPEEAVVRWWRDVVTQFLDTKAPPFEPDARRPYFLGRTLLDLGELYEQQGKVQEAKDAYRLLLQKKLPGEIPAKQNLERLGVRPSE